MGLKIAIGGKGGVGKTTITALLARCLAADTNNKVIAIDADPVANLAAGLGIDEGEPITPIAELRELIDREFYILSQAHYERYILTPDLFAGQGE